MALKRRTGVLTPLSFFRLDKRRPHDSALLSNLPRHDKQNYDLA